MRSNRREPYFNLNPSKACIIINYRIYKFHCLTKKECSIQLLLLINNKRMYNKYMFVNINVANLCLYLVHVTNYLHLLTYN